MFRGSDDSVRISIHALREESDRTPDMPDITAMISIHALREESDKTANTKQPQASFQSTLSVRRATAGMQISNKRIDYFNPRSP